MVLDDDLFPAQGVLTLAKGSPLQYRILLDCAGMRWSGMRWAALSSAGSYWNAAFVLCGLNRTNCTMVLRLKVGRDGQSRVNLALEYGNQTDSFYIARAEA